MANEDLQALSNLAIMIGGMIVVLGTYGSFHFGNKITKEKDAQSSKTGTISIPAVQKPWYKLGKGEVPKSLTIMYGGNNSEVDIREKENSHILMVVDGPDIQVRFDEGKMLITSSFYSYDGKLAAQLIDNEWKVGSNNWDRNYTNNCLEVKDPDGEIILQLMGFASGVKLQAKLYTTNRGRGVLVTDSGLFPNRSIQVMRQVKIHPIFKYPSEMHFGELTDDAKILVGK